MATRAIGTLGTIDTVTVGGRVFSNTSTTGLIVLVGYISTNDRCTLRKMSGTSGYTPSGSTTFKALAIKQLQFSASNAGIVLAQSDNDVGMNSATALTNPVYNGGDIVISTNVTTATAGSTNEAAIDFTIANAKFLSFTRNGGGTLHCIVYGYEV